VPHKKDHSPKSSPASEDPENDSIRHGLIFNMPPKFVPRQRKHKVLARQKHHNGPSEEQNDSNAVEHIPAAKAQLEEKKQRMKEELKKDGVKVSGKKAKRLEKYIETKLPLYTRAVGN
jgi:hypothetical protein